MAGFGDTYKAKLRGYIAEFDGATLKKLSKERPPTHIVISDRFRFE
jgi:hypothetical protein